MASHREFLTVSELSASGIVAAIVSLGSWYQCYPDINN